jgi:hypothetical protein
MNRDCFLEINKQKIFVWISILTFLNDMKQQQIFAKFLSSHVIYFCRFCDAESKNKNDLYKNITFYERYYHEILTLRKKNAMINDKFKKLTFFFNNDFKSKSFALQKLTSALNLIMNCSSNLVHNEYFKIIRKLFFFCTSRFSSFESS